MKKLLMLLMLFGTCLQVYAYSFSAVNSDGKTIYYRTANNYTLEVEVTNELGFYYSGIINIPSTVVYNGNTYNVTGIGSSAFSACDSLTSVMIPNSITHIDDGAFLQCTGLTTITIPNSVTSIGINAFEGCSNLINIILSDSLTTIDVYAFYDCVSLTNITIPNSVTSIKDNAFDGCINLREIIIGDNVQQIEYYAFENCINLETIVSYANDAPIIRSNTFFGVDRNIPVIVPCGQVENYTNNIIWGAIFNNICQNDTRDTINATICQGEVYTFNGNTYTTAGVYYDTLENANGCDSIIVLHISFNSSVDDVLQVVGVSLYPNPAEREVCLDIEGLQEDVEVFIFDIQGKEIKRYNYNKGERNLLMDVADLETGTYNIRIVGKTTNISKKLIVR